MEKLFAFVSVRFSAAAAWLHAEEVRFHGGVSPGEQLHAYACVGLQDLSLIRTHHTRIFTGGLKERKNIGAIEACDTAQGGNRRTHLAALQRAEKSHGNACGARDSG